MMPINKIINEDCLVGMKKLPSNSVNCCVTSPPYFGLRDYGVKGQIGLEDSPWEYIEKIVEVFREAKRILKNDGTLWLNISDTYAGCHGNKKATYEQASSNKNGYFENQRASQANRNGFKPKDMMGIPWRVAFALQDDGWYLRQDIIWHKPNPMPESVIDRCTKSHEYIFLFSKSQKYYYDAESIKTEVKNAEKDEKRMEYQTWEYKNSPDKLRNGIRPRKSGNKARKSGQERGCPENGNGNQSGSVPWEGVKANKRSVWTVPVKPFRGAHFATYPEELIVDCIKAGCPKGGIVIDPFMGALTTAIVSAKLGRNFIGFEINKDYISIGEKRLKEQLGLFFQEKITL